MRTSYEKVNIVEYAKNIVEIGGSNRRIFSDISVKTLGESASLTKVTQTFSGSKNKMAKANKLDEIKEHGTGAKLGKWKIQR